MEQNSKPLIRASIVVIMLFQVAALFSRSYLQIKLSESGFDATVAKHLSYFVVPVILLVLMWPILWQNKDALRNLYRRPKSWPKMILASVALGFSLRLAWWASILAAGSFGLLETAPPGQGSVFSLYFACPPLDVLLLTVFVMTILTPIEEELVFRGVILGALSRIDPRIAVVATALLFAAMHEPSSIPAVFIFGVFAGVQLLRYRTLWAPTIAHSTYNFLTVVDWDCFHAFWVPEAATSGTILTGAFATCALIASLATAIWIVGKVRAGAD